MASTRKPTQQAGAQQERDCVLRKIKRRLAELNGLDGAGSGERRAELSSLYDWLKARTARFNRKAGGLGARGGR